MLDADETSRVSARLERRSLADLAEAIGANSTWSSVAFRHALRVTVAATAALLIVRGFDLPHGSWMPMTVVLVLVADCGATLVKGLQRVAGTVVGVGIVAILGPLRREAELAAANTSADPHTFCWRALKAPRRD